MSLAEKIMERIRKINRTQLFILALLFLLGFGVRAHIMKYDWLFGFDSYYHARIVAEILQNGTVSEYDPVAYYQLDQGPYTAGTKTQFFWYFSALLYKIFTLGAAYNKELWVAFVKFLPAFYGALIVVAMFFLGKEMYGRKAGIAMAFFAAIVPSFVYRTMAGFFEEDSLGFLWLVIGFYFLVKALKNPSFDRKGIINAVVAGIFFGIMAWTWEMFLLVPLVLFAYFFWTVIIMWFKKEDKRVVFDFVKLFVIAMLIFSALATAVHQTGWLDRTFSYVKNYIPVTPENIERAHSRGEGILAQTVGEESTGKEFFGEKYNALIILPLVAFFLIPYRILRKRNDRISLIIFFWAIIAFYMAWSKLKFTYVFGLPIAACGGVIFAEMFDLIKERTKFEKQFVTAAMGFMMLIGIGAGTFFVSTKPPNIVNTPGWLDALLWLKDNTPEDAKMFNWWDEGHWIAFVAERGVITDNRNLHGEANAAFGMFIITEDENVAYSFVKEFGSDYVIVSVDLIMKQSSMAIYAYNTTDLSDPRLRRNFGFFTFCSRQVNELSMQATYLCGGNIFSEEQMNGLPSMWIDQPNLDLNPTTPSFEPGFIYREADNSAIYVVNPAENSSMLLRLWMHDPSITHFEEVYGNNGVRIFKVV